MTNGLLCVIGEHDKGEAAFQQIESDWGSFDNYVTEALELTPDDITRLRATLLE